MSSHQRRRLSEEGKRLLRRALHHGVDEDEERASNEHLSTDFSVMTTRDEASDDSDLEGFNELKGGLSGGAGGGGRQKHKSKQRKQKERPDDEEGHDELEEALEKLSEKRDTTKIEALRSILSILCSTVLTDRIQAIKGTLVTQLLTTLKKRMCQSGALSLRALSVLSITVGADAFYQEILQPVQRLITDQSDPILRIEAIYALAIACFVSSREAQQKWELLEVIGNLIVAAQEAAEETGDMEEVVTEELLLALIECWGFLVSDFPPSTIIPKLDDEDAIIYPHVHALSSFVHEGMNSTIRSAACEVLALLIQFKYAIHEDHEWSYATDEPIGSVLYGLDIKIRSYMRETGKSIGKKNRKIQRSMFKEVLETLETGEGPHQQVQVDHETLSISTWCRYFQANVFRRALQSGFQVHLYENDVLRDVFDVVEKEKVKNSMISTVQRRADHRSKAIHKRNDVSRKAAEQSAFLYDE